MKKLVTLFSVVTVCLTVVGSSCAAELAGVDIHAFVSQGFVQTTHGNNFPTNNSEDGSFNFNEFGINFGKQITSKLHVGMQLFAQDRGYYGNDDITIDYAYGDYRLTDWLGFRAGKIKNPMGLYNETRDNDSLRTNILLPQGIYTDSQRETAIALSGAGIYGTVPLGPAGAVSYQLQVGVLPITSDGGTAQTIATLVPGGSTPTDATSKTAVVSYLEWRPPVDGLRLAVSSLNSSFNVKTSNAAVAASVNIDDFKRYVFSTEYTWRDLVLAAEYMREDFTANTTATTLVDMPTGYPPPYDILPAGYVQNSADRNKRDSWYVSMAYRLNDFIETGVYYNAFDGNRDVDNRDYQNDTALTLRIDPIKDVVLKFEGHSLRGKGLMIDGPDGKHDWEMFLAKATYSF